MYVCGWETGYYYNTALYIIERGVDNWWVLVTVLIVIFTSYLACLTCRTLYGMKAFGRVYRTIDLVGEGNVTDWGSRWFYVLIFGNHYEHVLSMARK